MDDKKLIFLAIISSVATCGLLAPIWAVVLLIYFIIKAFTYKPKKKTEAKVILPDNSFVSEWTYEIRKVDAETE